MIGVGVGFNDPIDFETQFLDGGDDQVGIRSLGASGFGVVIEHRVDDGSVTVGAVVDEMTDGTGLGVVETLDVWGHGRIL